jgi:GT2 family glycosyltransferase/acetyltransferase-like isoleucine patch superfamily enzyme
VAQGVRVSVLVVTYNSSEEVASCLDALLAQEVPGGHEVIVVDNASTDGTAEVLAAYTDRVRLVLRPTNSGYAAGNNEALSHASGDLVALVNPDCIVSPRCLTELASYLEATPGVGMSAALLRNADGSPQLFARRELTLTGAVFVFTEYGRRVDSALLGGRHDANRRYVDLWQPEPTEPIAVDCPAAACVVMWRGLVSDTLFDERLPLLFNDGDLDRRLRERSYELHVVPSAHAVHGYGTSLRRVVRGRMRAERVASLRQYVSRDWGLWRCGLLAVALLLDVLWLLPKAVVGRRRGLNRALLRGTLGGLGLPGGDAPWLVTVPSWGTRLRRLLRRYRAVPRLLVVAWGRRWRRRRFLWQLRWTAWKARATVSADISKDADIARRISLEIRPGTKVDVSVGPRAVLRDGVVLRLAGKLVVGGGSDIRWRAVLNVKGTLRLGRRVSIGTGCAVHADGEQTWGWAVVAGEYSTVLDTDHGFDGTWVSVMDQPVSLQPVRIGDGSFLGAGTCVMPGVSIGRQVRVGAGSVVTRDLPDGCLAFGAPAKPRG